MLGVLHGNRSAAGPAQAATTPAEPAQLIAAALGGAVGIKLLSLVVSKAGGGKVRR